MNPCILVLVHRRPEFLMEALHHLILTTDLPIFVQQDGDDPIAG